MDAAFWKSVVTDVGFPIAAYGSLAYGIFLVIRWIGDKIVIPVRDNGFDFMKSLVDQLKQQTASLQSIDLNGQATKQAITMIQEKGCGRVDQCGNFCPKPGMNGSVSHETKTISNLPS